MDVSYKSATITNTGPDDAFPGTFRVVLSTPAMDRDGDELKSEEWQQPLPDHITFDIDHGMSVASTVGSGKPSINAKGQLEVDGTYTSLPQGQTARTLVNEGHINKTSVAFRTIRKQQKDGSTTVTRELLNGAFVAVPANDEAIVLEAKGIKTGARNSASDAKHIQAIHDHATALGATHGTATDSSDETTDGKSFRGAKLKAVSGSYEQSQQAISDALSALYSGNQDVWAYPVATFADTVVYRVSGAGRAAQWQAPYTLNDDGTVTLGTPEQVTLVEQILPVGKSYQQKDADTENATDPVALIQAFDAAIDEAIDLFATVDPTTLPAAVQQAIALVQAADTTVDELMDAAGIPDPDEDADDSAAPVAAAADSKSAAAASNAAVEDADSTELDAKFFDLFAAAFTATD